MWHHAWLVFSPVERDILLALLRGGPRKRSALADSIGKSEDAVKDLIANLTAKRILVNTSDGYNVNLPNERRPELLAWLEAQAEGG